MGVMVLVLVGRGVIGWWYRLVISVGVGGGGDGSGV